MRGSIEAWFESQKIRPRIVAEFEDSALIKVFGTDHRGFFVMPSIGSKEVAATYGVEIIGTTDACREEFYALSAERKLTHPAVIAIKNTARDDLFEPAPAS